jgi:hypothetical protein
MEALPMMAEGQPKFCILMDGAKPKANGVHGIFLNLEPMEVSE